MSDNDELYVNLFLVRARAEQAASDISLRGQASISQQQRNGILGAMRTLDDSGLSEAFNKETMHDEVEKLLIRMQYLCNRNGITIEDEYRPLIAQTLLKELVTNVQAFGKRRKGETEYRKPGDLVPLTLYQGTDFVSALTDPEFESLQPFHGVFVRAAERYPQDPKGYLQDIIRTVNELREDDEFAPLLETTGALRYAAINQKDPKEFLRQLMRGEAKLPRRAIPDNLDAGADGPEL